MTKPLLAVALVALAGCKDKPAAPKSGDAMAMMARFRDQMCACKDAACAKRVSQAMADWGKQPSDHKPAALTTDEQKQATELGTKIGECMARATGGVPQAQAPSPQPPTTGPLVDVGSAAGSAGTAPRTPRNTQGLPVECDDYKDAIAKIASCERIAPSARETLVKAYEDAATRWSSMNEGAKTTLTTSCQGGLDAVLAIGQAQCGW